ncbi:unnamed protein product [Ophioblennius macclurei]
MAQNFQSSILSLTLPISCQICLGKVRQPVICTNHHVFCSSCMEMWLKKASQCPTCRVPITAESPYREIIGGSNEGDHSDNPSIRKCLRKTRGELLFREYEEEIEKLMSENEELKTKNLSLEAQMKAALSSRSDNTAQAEDSTVLPFILKDLENNVQAAEDTCAKLKQDMEKLKETNKALRSQNNDLVQENMRLKVEVDNRSPHKFGRFTVAALEAKTQHYERDIDHLKRALDRSDQYIDDLESRLRKSEKRCQEMQEACRKMPAGTESLSQQRKINMMMRSLSDNERELICSNPEAECSTFPRNPNVTSRPSAERKAFNVAEARNAPEDQKNEDSESTSDFLPSTPSAAFRTLTLRSPGIREKKVAFKPPSHQRRLDFNITPEKPRENPYKYFPRFPRGFPSDFVELSKSSFWGCLQKPNFDQPYPGPSQRSLLQTSASSDWDDDDSDNQMSSEACMNAAYLDKISELDSMMLEGEGSASAGSQLSPPSTPPAQLDNTLVPDSQSSPADALPTAAAGNVASQSKPRKPHLDDKESQKCSSEDGAVAREPCRKSSTQVPDSTQHSGNSQSEELSFDLLFDAMDEDKAGPSAAFGSASQDHDRVKPSSASSSSSLSGGGGEPANTRAQALNSSQPVKRKSHSPFSTNSPTKLSKLM